MKKFFITIGFCIALYSILFVCAFLAIWLFAGAAIGFLLVGVYRIIRKAFSAIHRVFRNIK